MVRPKKPEGTEGFDIVKLTGQYDPKRKKVRKRKDVYKVLKRYRHKQTERGLVRIEFWTTRERRKLIRLLHDVPDYAIRKFVNEFSVETPVKPGVALVIFPRFCKCGDFAWHHSARHGHKCDDCYDKIRKSGRW